MDAPTQLPSPPPPSALQKSLLPGRSVMRALAAFVLAAGLLLGAYLHAYESALMDATRAVAQVGQSSAVRLSDLLSRGDALSRNIASQTAGVQNSLATSATLIEMGRLIPQAHAVLLLSGTGKLLGSSQFLVHAAERPGDQAWFKAARAAAAGTISLAHVTGAGMGFDSDQIVLASRLLSRAGQPDRVVAIVFGRDAFRRLVVPDWTPQRVSVTVVAATGDVLFASANVASAGSAGVTAAAARPPEQGAIEPAAPPGTPSLPADRLKPLRFLSGPISTTVPLPRDGLQVQSSFSGTLPLQGDALGLLQWNLWLGIGLFALAAVAALGSASQGPGSGTQQLEVLRDRIRTQETAEAAQQTLREEIERVRQDRDRVLASVGHDVRTPMTSILGLTSLLQDSDLQDDHRHLVAMIAASSETLLAMLDGLLEIARGEAGEAPLMIEDVDVAGLVGDVCRVLETQAHEKGLDLNIRVGDEVNGIWRTDATRLRRILLNLVGNAIKYTSAGHIEVSAHAGADTEHGRLVRLCVSDTGPGIPESDRERIFEAFNRGSRTGTTTEPGLGLGLAICKDNAALLCGTLTLESTVGVGSEFTFEFHAEQAQRAPTSGRFKGATAIIVGFTDIDRRRLAHHLDSSGFVVDTAADGFMGLGLIERTASVLGSADLALLDGSMRGMPSETFVKRLKAAPFSAGVRLVAIANSDNADFLRELPVDALVRSPGEAAELSTAVDRVMAGWSPLQMLDPNAPSTPDNRILVVEDNPINRSLLKSLLSTRGFSVFTADSGEEGVLQSVRGNFQAILMDIELPGIDGLEATRRIRAMNHSVRDVPILALTALMGNVIKKRCLAAGMTAMIQKPVNPQRLAETVRKFIAQAQNDNAVANNELQIAPGAEPQAPIPQDYQGVSATFLEAVVEDLGELRAKAALDTFIADTNIRLARLGELVLAWEKSSIVRLSAEVSEWAGTFGAIALSEALDELAAAVDREERELAQRQVAEVAQVTAQLAPALRHQFDAIIAARAKRRAA